MLIPILDKDSQLCFYDTTFKKMYVHSVYTEFASSYNKNYCYVFEEALYIDDKKCCDIDENNLVGISMVYINKVLLFYTTHTMLYDSIKLHCIDLIVTEYDIFDIRPGMLVRSNILTLSSDNVVYCFCVREEYELLTKYELPQDCNRIIYANYCGGRWHIAYINNEKNMIIPAGPYNYCYNSRYSYIHRLYEDNIDLFIKKFKEKPLGVKLTYDGLFMFYENYIRMVKNGDHEDFKPNIQEYSILPLERLPNIKSARNV